MDGKEFLESKQVKNIILGISNQIGVVDLATLLDLYKTEQLKLHSVVVPKGTFNCFGGNHAKSIKPCVEHCGEDICLKPSN